MDDLRIAVAGNPNSGKTTLFNALTGSRQRVGNWPGVTVEKKSGTIGLEGREVEIVDLPGIYSLTSHSEDEKVARDYLLSREASLVLNIVDASNLERNLFLTLNLLEMKVPLVVVLNMVDLAEKKGLKIDPQALSRSLGVPVIPLSAVKKADVEHLKKSLPGLISQAAPSPVTLTYSRELEEVLTTWTGRLESLASHLGADARWVGIKLLEADSYLSEKAAASGALDREAGAKILQSLEDTLGDPPDALIAEAKFGFISQVTSACRTQVEVKRPLGEAIDKVVLNRFLGIPIFLGVMYLLFWTVINVGGAFIDFFDIAFGAIFVDGFSLVLEGWGTPGWLVAVLAGGVGAGVQTMATFVPIMFAMFFSLSVLENSGYMARAAFVMDRFLRSIGLPGKAFIPLIVGFGCTVPAVLGTRTLENKRDRFLTVFMTPLMSCGARLPVYALFGAAFFADNAGFMVFTVYLAGIILAVLTGFLLKNTVFKGDPAPFVMELPPYHAPRIGDILFQSGQRMGQFVLRAGKLIVPAVTLLGLLNAVGTDGTIGNEDTDRSLLAAAGQAITPVFNPMGISQENWPATVGLFTGLFAKEAVVGTLNGLYGQIEAQKTSDSALPEEAGAEQSAWDLGASLWEAWETIPAAFAGLAGSLTDPLGLGVIGQDEATIAEEVGADQGLFATMRAYFNNSPEAAYAYLLFILIYFPCVAALGAILKEIGAFYGWISVAYLTVLAWVVATLYYQISLARDPLWITVASGVLGLIFLFFILLRRKAPLE